MKYYYYIVNKKQIKNFETTIIFRSKIKLNAKKHYYSDSLVECLDIFEEFYFWRKCHKILPTDMLVKCKDFEDAVSKFDLCIYDILNKRDKTINAIMECKTLEVYDDS